MAKVIFYGPLGKANSKVVGGGESGNLKTISILEKLGFDVIQLRKPYSSESLIGKIRYILCLFFMPFLLLFKILKNRDVQIVHISGFYMHLIYQELILIYIVKLLGKNCIYELRAGGVKESYIVGSKLYKFFFRKAVLSSDVLLVQGERYVEFLNELAAKRIVHYPNYIMGLVTPRKINILGDNGRIKLVYFGRMSATKNVLFILDVCVELKNKEIPCELELIGEGEFEYIEQIKEKIREEKLADFIKLSPPAFGSNLVEKLKDKHFFLFPTQEPREGHSNSLTEAMALGLVPICSDYGFNREIVSSDRLIITEFNTKSYSDLIIEIWQQNLWADFSKDMQAIVASKFTSSIVQSKLILVYQQH
ncbi:glycosyltransferase family 4 protein [Kriegella aquimaris]|uniref:Glycosyltransferase involved in cell wall bisynthesis n=1 Tax=Kriegella aquimaris TaxID=192904 RepID=A0A1G9U5S8_9FLAO|nr:glycosyltransferase family 4 protein [Kriegella aquimaris]SDM55339.1 Glycosyltransferase involved in cell wall bisynthesis [Kriegella aquimaris]